MFDQLAKRSNRLWVYTTGRFAEERRSFLCYLSSRGHSLLTLRNVNKLLLAIAERGATVTSPFYLTIFLVCRQRLVSLLGLA